jgi:hypothetical protein
MIVCVWAIVGLILTMLVAAFDPGFDIGQVLAAAQ